MFFSSWLRKRHPIQRQTRAAVPRRFRPAMEPLEDRSVPAVLNFMTTLGVIAAPQIASSAGSTGVDLVGVIALPQIASSAGSTGVDLVGVSAPPQMTLSAGSTAFEQGQFTNLGQPLTTSVGLDQLSELSELRLQMAMDRNNVLLTTLSNLEGLMANTAQSIVGNLK